MEFLGEITDADAGTKAEVTEAHRKQLRYRRAARAIILREGTIALLSVKAHAGHKLPGGGVEEGEDLGDALTREVLEETGASIIVTGEVGCILEHRAAHSLIHLSYCYSSICMAEPALPSFTEEEEDAGYELLWLDPERALRTMEADRPATYMGRFIRLRDIRFLEAWMDGKGRA